MQIEQRQPSLLLHTNLQLLPMNLIRQTKAHISINRLHKCDTYSKINSYLDIDPN